MDMKLDDYFAQRVFGIIYWVLSTNGAIITFMPRIRQTNQKRIEVIYMTVYTEYTKYMN